MNGSEFLALADRLADENLPASCRTAVSRAYYGSFHLARSVLNRLGWYCTGGKNEHQWVQWHYLNCTSDDFMAIGKLLENLHASRKHADYDLDKAFADGQPNARAAVARAQDLQERLTCALVGGGAATIRQEMEAYRKKAGLSV